MPYLAKTNFMPQFAGHTETEFLHVWTRPHEYVKDSKWNVKLGHQHDSKFLVFIF